jgi:hypothetical protein
MARYSLQLPVVCLGGTAQRLHDSLQAWTIVCKPTPTCCPSSRLDDRDTPEPVRDSPCSLVPAGWQAVKVVAAGVHCDGASTSLSAALSSSARRELAEGPGLISCRQACNEVAVRQCMHTARATPTTIPLTS